MTHTSVRRSVFLFLICTGVANSLPAFDEPLPAPKPEKHPNARVEQDEPVVRRGPLARFLARARENLAEATQAPLLDSDRLNGALEELIAPLVGDDTALKSLRLRIVPEDTNLLENRLHIAGGGTLRRAAWSEEPTRLELDLQAGVEPPTPETLLRPRGTIEGTITLETDTLPLANLLLSRAKKKLKRAAPAGPPNADTAFESRLREKLGRQAPLADLDELADLFTYISGLKLSTVNEEIEAVTARLSESLPAEERAALAERLAEIRLERDGLLRARARVERDDRGRVREVGLSLDGAEIAGGVFAKEIEIVVQRERLTVRGAVSMTRGVQLLLLAKVWLLPGLARFQDRDPILLRMGRDGLRQGLDAIERMPEELFE